MSRPDYDEFDKEMWERANPVLKPGEFAYTYNGDPVDNIEQAKKIIAKLEKGAIMSTTGPDGRKTKILVTGDSHVVSNVPPNKGTPAQGLMQFPAPQFDAVADELEDTDPMKPVFPVTPTEMI